jgi:gliding motility-associated-like protein
VITTNANPTLCSGQSATLTANGAGTGGTYAWSPGSGLNTTAGAGVTASPTSTTTYTVTGTDGNGCSNTATATVTVNPLPNVTAAAAPTAICIGSSSTLTASGANSYVWSPNTGLNTTAGATVTANPTSTTTYTIVGTNTATQCTNTATVTLTVHPLPVITANAASPAICLNSSTNITANGAGAGGGYVWSPATGLSSTTGATVTASPAVNTTYTVSGTDANGCSNTAIVTITVNPLPVISAGNVQQAVCNGISVQLQATGGVSYVWSPAAGLNNTQVGNPVATPSVTTTYTVTGTDANSCSNTDTVTVYVNQLPVINAGLDETICVGASTQLLASGAQTYIWSPANTLNNNNIPNPVATPAVTTTYTVTGTDAFGCKDSARVTITVLYPVSTSISPDADICVGGSTQLTATGGMSYIWFPAAGLDNALIANPIAQPDTTTTYTVVITENICFSDTLQVTIAVHPYPTILFTYHDFSTFQGNSLQLNPYTTNATQFAWTPAMGLSCTDCASPIAAPTENTTYTLTASNEWNCAIADTVRVHITCDGNMIFLPNTFTPNGDGVNDVFYPRSDAAKFMVKMFRIYSRWGEVVFEAANFMLNDILHGWDGTHKGQQLPPDTYIYVLSADCASGGSIELKGDINLLR